MGNKITYGAKVSRLMTKIASDMQENDIRKAEIAEGRNPNCPGDKILNEFYEDVNLLLKGKPLTECSKFTKMNDNAIIVATITNPSFVPEAIKSTPKELNNIGHIINILHSLDKKTKSEILETIKNEFERSPISLTKMNHSCLVRRAALGKEADKKAFSNNETERE